MAPKAPANSAPSITVHAEPKISDNAPAFAVNDASVNLASGSDMDRWNFNGDKSPQPQPQPAADAFDFSSLPMQNNNFTWEMIGLGLEEPLPPQESIDEL